MSFYKVIFTILAAVVVLGGVYVITLFGPGKKAEYTSNRPADANTLPIEYLRESEILESQYQESAAAGLSSEEAIGKLKRALELHELYMERARLVDRAPHDRLLKLQKLLQNAESKPIAEKIEELEKEAEKESDSGSRERAITLYQSAYEAQAGLNTNYPLSVYRDLRKLAFYDRSIKMLEARPLYMKSTESERAAQEAVDKKDWERAQVSFEAAIEALRELIEKYPTSIYADFARLRSMESDLDSLKSKSLEKEISDFEKKAKEAEEKKDYMSAAERYADAAEYQRRLNKLFPASEFASEEKVKVFDAKRNEAFSWRSGSEILKQREALKKVLFEGKYEEAAEISANLLRKSEEFRKEYPQSGIVDDAQILSLRYINYMHKEVPNIRKLVLENLGKVDEVSDFKMLKTEVSQELYELVMQENPSRAEKNPKFPVESVRMDDISRFCSRLSMILARKVSLPDMKTYESAIGSLRYVNLNDVAWHHANSGGKIHEVATKKSNDKGFFDLLGNVAEYVNPDVANNASGEIITIGGSAQTSSDSMLDLAKSTISDNQRNRMVGFRIVVSDSIDDGK